MIEPPFSSKSNIVLSIEDKQKLVSAFSWLIQEDKKQNPELYRLKDEKLYN